MKEGMKAHFDLPRIQKNASLFKMNCELEGEEAEQEERDFPVEVKDRENAKHGRVGG